MDFARRTILFSKEKLNNGVLVRDTHSRLFEEVLSGEVLSGNICFDLSITLHDPHSIKRGRTFNRRKERSNGFCLLVESRSRIGGWVVINC